VIHGKSGSAAADYDRRKTAAQEFKDSLDTEYPNKINIIIGDYNDDLYKTICTACTTNITSYDPIVKDSANYKSLTLPLSKAGQTSEIGYTSVIDNHIVSAAGYTYYVAGSAAIRTDITNTIANYASQNTSDHYPVSVNYNFVTTAVTTINAAAAGIKLLNLAPDKISIQFNKTLQQPVISVTDAAGRRIATINRKQIVQGELINIDVSVNAATIFFIKVQTNSFSTVLTTLKK